MPVPFISKYNQVLIKIIASIVPVASEKMFVNVDGRQNLSDREKGQIMIWTFSNIMYSFGHLINHIHHSSELLRIICKIKISRKS